MQQYTNTAINYAGQYVNMLKQWWWPPQPIPLTALEQLKFYLENSNMHFKTKHTQQKIVIQRLCMMYNQLSTASNKKYQYFKPSIQKPIQYIDNINTKQKEKEKDNNSNNNNSNSDKSIVSIVGQMKIKTQKIKCNILITIVLHQQIQYQLPYIYIRNPDSSKTQPNAKFIQDQHIYSAILGGVTLSNIKLKQLKQQWKQYKPTNLLNLVSKIEKYLHQYFPFVKRYNKIIQFGQQSEQLKKIKGFKNVLEGHLDKIQHFLILKESIESQQRHIQNQNDKIKQILKQNNEKSEQNQNIILKSFKVNQNEELFQLLCRQKALLDCIKLIEEVPNIYENVQYEKAIEIAKKYYIQIFQVKFKINEILEKCKNQ